MLEGTTEASIGGGAQVDGPTGVRLIASDASLLTADSAGLSVAGFANVGVSYSSSVAKRNVTALVSGDATRVDTDAMLDIDATTTPSLTAVAGAIAVAGGHSVSGAISAVQTGGTAHAGVAGGTVDALTVDIDASASTPLMDAESKGLAASAGASGGLMIAQGQAAHGAKAEATGAITTDQLDVTAVATRNSTADVDLLVLSVHEGAAAYEAERTAGTTEALIGAGAVITIRNGGTVNISATSTDVADPAFDSFGLSPLAFTSMAAAAFAESDTKVTVGGQVVDAASVSATAVATKTANAITHLTTFRVANVTGFALDDLAGALPAELPLPFVPSFNGDTTAKVAGTTEAKLGSGGNVHAIGAFTLTATSTILADALLFVDGVQVVDVASNGATATAGGTTRVWLDEGAQTDVDTLTTSAAAGVTALTLGTFVGVTGVGISLANYTAKTEHSTEARTGPIGAPTGAQGSLTVRNGALLLDAHSTNTAVVAQGELQVAFLDITLIDPSATAGGSTRTILGGSFAVDADSVTGKAESTNSATSASLSIQVGAIQIDATERAAKTDHTTEALVKTGANLALGGLALHLDADSDSNAIIATVTPLDLGAISIEAMSSTADAGGETNAGVQEGVTIVAGSLLITADSDNDADIVEFAVKIAAIDIQVTKPIAKTSHTTSTYIGPKAGTAADGDLHSTITLGGGLTLEATSDNDASIAGLAIEISAISVKSLNPEVTTGGSTLSYIGGDAAVSATGVTAHATSTNTPSLVSVGFIVSAIGVTVNNTKLTTSHDTESYVSRDADFELASGAIVDLAATSTNEAGLVNVDFSLGAVTVDVLQQEVNAGGTTRAYVAEGATLVAGGLVLNADSTNEAELDLASVSISAVSINHITPVIRTSHVTEVYIGARPGTAIDGALSGSIDVGTGTIAGTATSRSTTDVGAFNVDISLFPITSLLPTLRTEGATRAAIGGNFTFEASAVDLVANTLEAEADADTVSVAIGLVPFTDENTLVVVNHTTEALIANGSTVTVIGGPLTLEAESNALATAASVSVNIGFVSVTAIDVTTKIFSATRAFVGDGATVNTQSGNLNLLATGTATASSRSVTGTGGLVSVPQADAEAITAPTVEASIRAGATIGSAGSVQVVANSRRAEADASASAFGGGFANIANASPDARSLPTVIATIAGGTTITAAYDVIVSATSDAIGDPGLDDFFDAADVNTSTDTIRFAEHGLITGDSVVYRPTGATPIGTPAGNLANGRTFGVVIVDDDLLRLGAQFMATAASNPDSVFTPGAGIDANRDVIRFLVRHNFQTGDAVRYDPSGGGLVNAGLNSTDTYWVRVIDPFTIKLALSQSAATAAPTSFTQSAVDNAGDYLTLAGFADGQAVTYRAPATVYFQTQGIDAFFNTIRLVADGDDHGLLTGRRYTYLRESGNHIGINNGDTTVYVIRVSATHIALAASEADALDDTRIDIDDDGDDRDRHALVRRTIGLTTGVTYYVVNHGDFGADTFQLSEDPGGSPESLTDFEVTGTHTLGVEGIELSAATGAHRLFIDFNATGGDNQRLLGPNDVSLRTIAPPPGNGISQSSGKGGGGGAVATGDPDGSTYITHTVNANVAATLIKAGHDVVISSTSKARGSAYGSSGSGGFVQVGNADARLEFNNSNRAFVGADGGGGIDATGTFILAGRLVSIHATSSLNADVESNADGGGFVSDSDAESYLEVHGATQSVVGLAADMYSNALSMDARWTEIDVDVEASATSGGLFGGAESEIFGTVDPSAQTILRGGGSTVTAVEGTDMRAEIENLDVDQDSSATCVCIGESDDDNNFISSANITSRVRSESGATLTTGPRVLPGPGVPAIDETPLEKPAGFAHLALFSDVDTTSNSSPGLSTGTREIDWNANLVVLAGPIPRLHISNAGKIVRAINVTVNDGQNIVDSDVDADNNGAFKVDDIDNADPGEVLFAANTIVGSGSTWDFRDSFDRVQILNESTLTVTLNDIDVLNRTVQPFVDLQLPAAPGLTFGVVRSVRPTLVEVDSNGAAVRINGTIENPIGTTSIVVPNGDVLATNDRDVPDGDGRLSLIRTNILDIETPSGGVGSGANRVNVDVVDSASIPLATTHKTTRVDDVSDAIFLGRHQFFSGELILYTTAGDPIGGLTSGNYYKIIVTPDGQGVWLAEVGSPNTPIALDPAATTATTEHSLKPIQRFTVTSPENIWLDVKGRLRDPGVVPVESYRIIIDAVVSGDVTDILLRASVDETGGSGLSTGILVKWPGAAPAAGQPYTSFYRPDGATPNRDVGAFGAGPGTEIESTYDIRAVDAFGNRTLPGIVSQSNIIVAAANSSPSATLIHVFGILEIVGDTFPEGPGDEHHVDILTNGNITINEKTGDLRVGAIVSTANDVLLYAPRMIVDALDDAGSAGPDVAGENISLCAASGLQLSGSISSPSCIDADLPQGGIGRPDNWLETDVDIIPTASGADLGVLRAFDITVLELQTEGIFISEVHGNLNVHTVHSVRDVGLNTLPNSGSIVDARNGGAGDDDPDVLGNNIDLDAAGGSIGNPDGSNDLEIDSFRGATCHLFDNGITLSATCDVGMEADGSIFVTETESALNLVLAHALVNIRLTVRESSDLDEHLNLLREGAALFFENPPDRPRIVLKGQVYAHAGFVLLRVGDNVTLDPRSEILAGTTIDIFGDDANADLNVGSTDNVDPTYGTNMTLRGRIVAGCVVVSTLICDPSTANPVHLAQMWGHTDVDTFWFGDPSGIGFGTTPGDPGYAFIGSKTRVHGSQNISSTDEADGEDIFTIWYLQTADVLAAPAGLADGPGAGHSLTLDGQAETDYYTVYTTGSHNSVRNYVINVLDTGASNDGVDELAIYGFDNDNPFFNGYAPGTTTRNATDDIFLLRAQKCIDTEGPYGVSDADVSVPTTCSSPTEVADRPAFVALLAGNNDADGGLALHRDRNPNTYPAAGVQRIGYDTALNGRLSVYGLGGNDAFFVDDNSAITTLDGGAGYDTFQIGQIFGLKRDSDEGALLPHDTFPELIATTRGWLSPGIHAPLVATGGTGNDEFVVYSNQAELRLEGDDDNDLFIVRAFALAAVCDTSADADEDCDFADIDLEADPDTGNFPVDTNASGTCTAAENPGYDGEGWTGLRKDNNGDGVCNKADAHITGAKTATTPADPTMWEDDVIPLDGDGVARPVIGLGFSTARPLDIRAGGGEDEVSYNVNAPVSVDGGTGFDKVVILGTEFADDIVISIKGIFGAGLNVRYDNIEVVEVDGLEGDDEFFILSTKYGVAYRVIGGLGSDTINVAGDVVEDIVTRELEGVSGTIDHRVSSALDALYDGLPVDGIDYNLATPDNGQIIIDDEGPEGTSVREGGSLSVPTIDKYSIRLASNPGAAVYVTISAARSAQEEADDAFSNIEPTDSSDSLDDGNADTIWLCTPGPGGDCSSPSHFKRSKFVNGVAVDENNRALVFTFGPGDWGDRQWLYVLAVDDPRSEGDRVVVIQHSSISTNPDFDRVAVRNVEVSVRDNDTPGIYVTEITPGSCALQCEEDRRTLTIEGSDFMGTYTGRTDELLVQLQKDPGTLAIRVKLVLDARSQTGIQLDSLDPRFAKHAHVDANPLLSYTYYTIQFTGLPNDWQTPVLLTVTARPDGEWEDPQTAVINFMRDDNSVVGTVLNADGTVDYAASELPSDGVATFDPTGRYIFPNLRSGTGRTAVEVIDDDSADIVSIESGTGTIVQKCGNDPCTIPSAIGTGTDWYTIRLTKRPTGGVDVAVLTDGMVDVVQIGASAITPAGYEVIGGPIPSQLFVGNLAISADGLTLTRANGSDLTSFVDEGFEAGNLVRLFVAGIGTVDVKIAAGGTAVTDLTITLASALPVDFRGHVGTLKTDTLSFLTLNGWYEGVVSFAQPSATGGWQMIRSDASSWLDDGFLEGQWVEVCSSAGAGACVPGSTGRFKIAIIRGDNSTKDEKIEFRFYEDLDGNFHLVDDLAAFAGGTYLVRRIAPVVHFTTLDWFYEQTVTLQADVGYVVPISRQGVKFFPVNTHGLWKLQGPLAVEGGVSGADRSLKLGLKLPGENDGPLFKIGTQPPESKQIDVLNIFHDGSKEDGEGTMTSTTLSGFGLADDLDFGPTYSTGNPQTFGEPAIFPGGIGFGTVQFIDGKFSTDGARSSIEVVNFFGGAGNDELDVQGTLDPEDPVKLTGTIIISATASGIDLTRPEPFDWKAQGFLVGQPVKISGYPGLQWVVIGFADDDLSDTQDNTRMQLAGPVLTAAQIANPVYSTFFSAGPLPLTLAPAAGGGTATRAAGSWLADGFLVGQRVTISGLAGSWRVKTVTANVLGLENGAALPSSSLSRTIAVVVQTVVAGDVPVQATVPITIAGGAFGGYVTRTDGLSWKSAGFQEGQLVRIQGIDGSWRLRRIEGANFQTLRLERGSLLPTITAATTRMVFWPGPHGGLTALHGGGNTALRIEFEMDSASNSVTRLDGRSWIDAGFSVGQRVQVEGDGKTRTITGFENSTCPFPDDPFPGCGLDSRMLLSADVLGDVVDAGSNVLRAVHVADVEPITTTAAMNITVQAPLNPLDLPTSTLTCASLGCFGPVAPNGTVFQAGMLVHVSGMAGPWTVVSVGASQMVLQGAALQPTYAIVGDALVFTPIVLTVSAVDASFDGGVRMGGDTIVVCNATPLDASKPCRGPQGTNRLAGPESPLVVYGDTTQDGTWYGGRPDDTKGMEFGPKPFDPFYKIPDADNEDDEWVFPLANPFDFAGHDIIDASNLFADVGCTAAICTLPTVGFTAYGGSGNDLIIGSQTGDHLAGGSGDDTILGLRGVDHIYGDSGVNVDVLTRALSISATNASPAPTLDRRLGATTQTIKPVPSANADLMIAGRDVIYGESPDSATVAQPGLTYTSGRTVHAVFTVTGGPQEAYDDVIFGDHGAVIQQTADPNEPDKRLQKIQTTTLASIRLVESRAYDNGADDAIFGNLGRDVVIAGAGHDLADGDEADDMVFGDNAFLLRRVAEAEFPLATNYAGPVNTTSGRFQALCGTLLYSRTDRANACLFGNPVGADTSGLLLVNGTWQSYRDPDSPGIDAFPWWAEYLVDFDDEDLSHQFHSFDVQLSVDDPTNLLAKGAGSFGNDYLAGSQGHDLLFGQMGDDVIQGDGGIEAAFAGTSHAGASRSPDGCTGVAGTNLSCDYVGDLDIVASFEATTDGEDYIEGGGGDDIVFGGLGQDDIVGGSSDFFGLVDETLSLVGQHVTISGQAGVWRITQVNGDTLTLSGPALPAVTSTRTVEIVGANRKLTAVTVTLGDSADGDTLKVSGFSWAGLGVIPGVDRRPDGADLLYGGAGTREDRNVDAIPTTAAQSHARDADTIARRQRAHRADRRHERRRARTGDGDRPALRALELRQLLERRDVRRQRQDRRARRDAARLHAGRPGLRLRGVRPRHRRRPVQRRERQRRLQHTDRDVCRQRQQVRRRRRPRRGPRRVR